MNEMISPTFFELDFMRFASLVFLILIQNETLKKYVQKGSLLRTPFDFFDFLL